MRKGEGKEPVTQAARELRAAGVRFEGHPYRYVTGGGTAQFASEYAGASVIPSLRSRESDPFRPWRP